MIDRNKILKTHKEIREFIEKNSGNIYNNVLITKKMYDEFNAIDYIDNFEIRSQCFCSGHGSSDYFPFISVPSVRKLICETEEWYELAVGTPASTSLLRCILNGYSEMLHDNC